MGLIKKGEIVIMEKGFHCWGEECTHNHRTMKRPIAIAGWFNRSMALLNMGVVGMGCVGIEI